MLQLGHEPTPYKKRAKKKKAKKSDHKHKYVPVIGVYEDMSLPFEAEQCTICGKTNTKFWISERVDTHFRRLLSLEEAKEKYPDMPVVALEKL